MCRIESYWDSIHLWLWQIYQFWNFVSSIGERYILSEFYYVLCLFQLSRCLFTINQISPDPMNRVAPNEPPTHRNDGQGYSITPARLAELRRHFLYWFFDQGGSDNNGDYQKWIHASNPQVHKNFNFQLPFFGFRFNYTRVSTYLADSFRFFFFISYFWDMILLNVSRIRYD